MENTNKIASHAIRESPRTAPSRFTEAHASKIYLHIMDALAKNELHIKRQALQCLCELYHKPVHVNISLMQTESKILVELVNALKDEDAIVRELTSLVLTFIAKDPLGSSLIVSQGHVPSFITLLSDTHVPSRVNGYRILMNFTTLSDGLEIILQYAITEVFVQWASADDDNEVQALALQALCICLTTPKGFEDAIGCDGVIVTTRLLQHFSINVKAAAAKCAAYLSMHSAGRKALIQEGAVRYLVEVAGSSDLSASIEATAALMFLLLELDAKFQALEYKAVGILVNCLQHSDTTLKCNSLQALTCICEAPNARNEMQSKHLNVLQPLLENQNVRIAELAKRCVSVVSWLP